MTSGKIFPTYNHDAWARNIPAYAGKTENGMIVLDAKGGTSPRTRGKHHQAPCPDSGSRNIPAHAGKTLRSSGCQILNAGTSPRTRGKPPRCGIKCGQHRNIPAHAGKTPPMAMTASTKPEHPRARGENFCLRRKSVLREGTSPRTRGKRGSRGGHTVCPRNIPAHAGKTPGPVEIRLSSVGTSPRTRGKPTGAMVEAIKTRNIPAHAGKTALFRASAAPR